MKKAAVIQTLLLLFVGSLSAQNSDKKSVVIGERADRPNAILFLNPANRDQGFLPPQLTTQQRINIQPSSPNDDGLFVFDTDEEIFYTWKNNAWVRGFGEEQLPPMNGNAGKYLTTDGTQASWTSTPLNTSYLTIDPSDFLALKADLGSGTHNTAVFESDNTFIIANDNKIGKQVMAPVHLPHNAVVQEVTVYYMDIEATRNLNVKLLRKKFDGNNEELFSWTSSGNSAGIQNSVTTNFNDKQQVDNSAYTYRVLVTFDLAGLVDLPGNAPQRLYGIRIKYN